MIRVSIQSSGAQARSLATCIVLAALLVVATGASASHNSDHFFAHDDSVCSVCVSGERDEVLPEIPLFSLPSFKAQRVSAAVTVVSYNRRASASNSPRGPPG